MGTAHPDKYRELVNEVTGQADGHSKPQHGDIVETVIDAGLPALQGVILDIVERN